MLYTKFCQNNPSKSSCIAEDAESVQMLPHDADTRQRTKNENGSQF